jgi:hypothetical protein
MDKAENIHSHHTFMLPFIFDMTDKKDIIKNWDLSVYTANYNEEAYFHRFFKESMFGSNCNSEFYIQEQYNDAKYIIKIRNQEYTLNLKNVNLRIFDTGIGILTLNIENKSYFDIKSILEINDYARRISPEYLDFEEKKSGLVPDFVQINDVIEDFNFEDTLKTPYISKIIQLFLPKDKIIPAVDDRMFTISFYQNKPITEWVKSNYEENDKWYEYVFVDGNGKTVQDEIMQKQLIKNASYTRWKDYGTMYGMSKYSFVCLSSSEFPLEHMKTMYFSMFSLLLMVRATLLKFSSEVSSIVNDLNDKKTSQNVTELYENYIQFVNKFYFREITAKDQGLEIYEKALAVLNIQRDIKDLDDEIEELHQFVKLQSEKKSAESMNYLTWIGAVLLPPSILTGYFGMNTLGSGIISFGFSTGLIIISAVIIPLIMLIKQGKI